MPWNIVFLAVAIGLAISADNFWSAAAGFNLGIWLAITLTEYQT